jgi:replicative DNA helicase
MTTDRLPPNDEATEAAFLGSLLLGNREPTVDVLAQHRDLAGYFYTVAHQTIFAAIRDLSDAGEPVDIITTKGRLEKLGTLADAGGLEYLNSLPDKAPSGWNAPYYADQLRELFIKRRAIAACVKVSEHAYNGATTAELLETVERELNGIAFENAPVEPDMRALVQGCIDDIEQAHASKGKPQGLTTGLCDLDRLTHGLRPGQLFIIGARPGEGKTSLAVNIAEHVALDCKKPVGLFSLEMTAKELTLRLISSRSAVPLDRLLSGDLIEEHFRQMTLANSAIAKAPLHIADEDGITIGQLRAKARRMHRKHNLALLVVDYLQLVRPSRPNSSRNVEVSEISSSLKALGKELRVPMIVLSQLNRDSDTDNREPRLRDLRDSGSIEQDADIVGLLHRPKPEEPAVTLNIAKHRQGPKRKLHLVFFGETFRFQCADKPSR